MVEENRIIWKEENQKIGLTAYNHSDEELGWLQLERVDQHMHWCWYQNEDIRMSPGCLQEVRDKQKELFKNRGKK